VLVDEVLPSTPDGASTTTTTTTTVNGNTVTIKEIKSKNFTE